MQIVIYCNICLMSRLLDSVNAKWYLIYCVSLLLTDERESVQKKTFTKWVNSHLSRVGCKIQDLYVDLRDGKMLIKLLEVLSGERLVRLTKISAALLCKFIIVIKARIGWCMATLCNALPLALCVWFLARYCHDVRPSVCVSRTGMHCDHTMHFNADLSLWFNGPVF